MRQLDHSETQREERTFPLILACDNWQDPRNVGMAFRLADAFGVQEIWLGGQCPVPPNRKISKTARSTDNWVPYRAVEDLADAIRTVRMEGAKAVGLEITDDSLPVFDAPVDWQQPTILVVGAESEGISGEVLHQLEACYHIPMYGRNSSLNVVTAVAIVLADWSRRGE